MIVLPALPPLFRRLLLQSLFPLTLVAPHATAQAAEGSDASALILTAFDPSGLSTADMALTFSEGSDSDGPDSDGADNAAGDTQTPTYGPFHLVSPDTIEMAGTVDSDTPRQFDQLMMLHPGVRRLVMVACPGSLDEDANRALARKVRAARLVTTVPPGGSVGSGAVDLFLAGVERTAAPSAEFVVHSWRDEDGDQPEDFAADDPVNTGYIAYYRDMGLSEPLARKFYALTNSVPFEDARTLSAMDMADLGLARLAG